MTWAGLDVHARSIQAAAVLAETGELRRMRFGAEPQPVVAWLSSLPGPVHACYEAGPTGYGLARAAVEAGLRMDVIAPSKTPRAAGDRVKTDRKDAELLVRLLMAGQLRAVAVPPPAVEAARDLTRAREAVRVDLARWRHRISKLLLRYGRVWPRDKSSWTLEHRAWLERQRFDQAATELAYTEALAAMDGLLYRRAQLDDQLALLARDPRWWPTVARLRGFRGIDTLSALALHLEVHDWQRFRRPSQVAAWVGLVPSREQSGEGDHHGSITKTGSAHARRLLVEAAWHYQRRPAVGLTLRRRQDGLPDHVLALSARCQRRLYRLHHQLKRRGKPANVATVAAARELTCFLWAAATAP
jgi:transposase